MQFILGGYLKMVTLFDPIYCIQYHQIPIHPCIARRCYIHPWSIHPWSIHPKVLYTCLHRIMTSYKDTIPPGIIWIWTICGFNICPTCIQCCPNLFEIWELSVKTLRPETEVGKIWNNCGDIYVLTWATCLENSLRPAFKLSFFTFVQPPHHHRFLCSISLEFSVKIHFHFPQPS